MSYQYVPRLVGSHYLRPRPDQARVHWAVQAGGRLEPSCRPWLQASKEAPGLACRRCHAQAESPRDGATGALVRSLRRSPVTGLVPLTESGYGIYTRRSISTYLPRTLRGALVQARQDARAPRRRRLPLYLAPGIRPRRRAYCTCAHLFARYVQRISRRTSIDGTGSVCLPPRCGRWPCHPRSVSDAAPRRS